MQAAAAEAQPNAKASAAPVEAAEAVESPSQMAASDRIEDSDKEGAAKAPQPIATTGTVQLRHNYLQYHLSICAGTMTSSDSRIAIELHRPMHAS